MKNHCLYLAAALLTACVALTACAGPYSIETPPQMVALEEDSRDYVAMTHDGVVLRARVLSQGQGRYDVPRAEHDFWVEATRERMRTAGGYALLDEKEVQSADGHRGTRLEFGRDHNGRPYHYWMILFVTEDNIHVIDAGGAEERFEGARDAVEAALSSYEVLK